MGSERRMAVVPGVIPGNWDRREAPGGKMVLDCEAGARGKLLKLLREEKSGTSSPGPEERWAEAEYSIITSWLESLSLSGLDSSSASARSSFL